MYELILERADANLPALDAALRAALGDAYAGLSRGKGRLRVHFKRPPLPDEEARARQSVAAHDSAALTAEQQTERDRRDRLASLDADIRALDLSAPLLPPMQEKAVRWLLLREIARG